jgi:hypothetical protein
VDVFAIDWRDEREIEPECNVMRDAVPDMLDVFDPLGLGDWRLVVLHHVFQEPAPFDHIVRRALEEFEKAFLFWYQAKHQSSLSQDNSSTRNSHLYVTS